MIQPCGTFSGQVMLHVKWCIRPGSTKRLLWHIHILDTEPYGRFPRRNERMFTVMNDCSLKKKSVLDFPAKNWPPKIRVMRFKASGGPNEQELRMKEIRGAVAVITGAGSGIGRALAIDLAQRGAHLALADVNSSGLDETRKLVGKSPVQTYTVDVGKAAEVEDFARRVQQDIGRASLLVNNAGVALFGTFAEVSLEDMEWLISINLWGVIHGCKFFLPMLQREPDAHIVNVSSVFGLIGPPGQTAYSASKFAVRGFSESLREELRSTSVKVTSVHPAGISTPIAENARAGEASRAEDREQAKERFKKVATIPPEQAARTIVKGILGNKNRVLIGKDAYRIDVLQRLMPARANSMLSDWLSKRTEKEEAQLVAGVKRSDP